MAFSGAAIGIGLSAVVHVVLQQWEIERFGYPDPEFVGWTAALFGVLIGQATAHFGSQIAPRKSRGWPTAATVVGAAIGSLIVVSNLPGLEDGIRPESVPLAIWIAASGVYLLATTGLAVMRAFRS